MRHQQHTLPPRRRRAFTTIEALIAATILAILTAAVSGALMAGRTQSKIARDTLSASFLAQSLMDEIMRLPFDPQCFVAPGPEPGETRPTFSHVDDYNGYADGGATTITDLAANPYPDTYAGFTRSVSMTLVSTAPAGWNRTLTGLLVTVTVSKDGSELIHLQRIAWN
jgi:type II secretory pathway pseudopilin PulG